MKIRKLSIAALFLVFYLPLAAEDGFKKSDNQNGNDGQYRLMKELLESKSFILSADYVYKRYDSREEAYSDINFIKVDSSTAVIQTGAAHKFESNRVGGFTEKGKITQWKLNEITKKEAIVLSVHVIAKTGTYDVRFYVNANNRATAYVSGTGSRQLVFEGYLSPLEGSAAYEGETF